MNFAQYYKDTPILKKLLKLKENGLSNYTKEDNCIDVFVCMDVKCFWVCRILKNMNEDYEIEDGKYLIERASIENENILLELGLRSVYKNLLFKSGDTNFLIETAIRIDDKEGLENWDVVGCNSYDEVIDILDNGYGIIELEESIMINKKEHCSNNLSEKETIEQLHREEEKMLEQLQQQVTLRDNIYNSMYGRVMNNKCKEVAQKCEEMGIDADRIQKILVGDYDGKASK